MKFISGFRCTECGTLYPSDTPMNLCPKDDRPVKMEINIEALAAAYPDMSWYRPEVNNMWRFGPLMPFDIGNPEQANKIKTLGEGHTPVLAMTEHPFAEHYGITLFLKDEGQAHRGYGANPTGSFKDRGMAMVTTMASHFGLTKLAVPTQGNAGDSLTEYGAKHHLGVSVVMPDDTPMPIMGKVAAYQHIYDKIELHLVKGTIREAGAFMKEHLLPDGFFNCATFQEPGWRIEGKKTMGLELAEPWPGLKEQWQLPDVVLYPTGGGTGILGMWKAFDELEALGVVDAKRPKIVSVQSENNAPVVDAVKKGLEDTVPTDGGDTLAVGLNVPGGVGQKAVLEVLRESKGGGVCVSEDVIAQHIRDIYQTTSLWISPEGASCFAAIPESVKQGLIKPGNTVVCFNTGSAEKYWPSVRHLFNAT